MSIIARYVNRLLLGRFALVLLGLAALMLLVEFLGNSDQVIAANDDALRALAFYMVLRLPDILAEIIPVAALLAGLLAFAELARHSELTAIYAGGMSKVRLALAIVPVVVADQWLPAPDRGSGPTGRHEGVARLGRRRLRRDEARATWLRRDADILRIEKIDPGQVELHGLTIFRRDADGNLIAKIDAVRAPCSRTAPGRSMMSPDPRSPQRLSRSSRIWRGRATWRRAISTS